MNSSLDRLITLLPSGTTASAAPTINNGALGTARPFLCEQAVLLIRSTAGTGTLTVTGRLWGYHASDGFWYDLGPINGGAAVGETSLADQIAYAEGVSGLSQFDRFYFEITALGGTSTAITVKLSCRMADSVTTS